MYAFQSESTLYSCLNIKELLARNKRDIWSLSDSNGIRTHNHLVGKRTLNHLAKVSKWILICTVHLTVWYYHVTYAFQSESIPHWWIYTLPLLDVRHCYKLSLYVMSRKKQDPNARKWWKTLFWTWFSTVGPEFGSPKLFFSKILASSVTKYHSQLSCAMPGKTNDPILRIFSDGWTDSYFLKDVYKEAFSIFFKAILNFITFDINRLIA